MLMLTFSVTKWPPMRSDNLPLSSLLLDPNNYRLQEIEGFTQYPADRFHIDRVQEATRRRLKEENLEPLKSSIVSNGFLEIERIVVTPYQHTEGKYLVIEGNRRIAALLAIQEDYDAGIEVPDQLVGVFDAVPCIVAEEGQQEAYFREAIMGIRHVGGIREWGGFQRAKLVADLRDGHGLDASSISDRIGLSAIEVNRRYRAYKALQQMQNDEDYSEFSGPSLYPLFHEAVSIPAIRDWLGWNQETNHFENDDTRDAFYQLISPRKLDEGEERPPKLKTYSDIRAIREVLANEEAKADLMMPERELVDALTIANQSKMSQRWRSEVNEAKTALSKLPGLEVAALEEKDLELIKDLIDTAQQVLMFKEKVSG